MKVYLAATYNQKERVKLLTQQLNSLGIETTNDWQNEPHGPGVNLQELDAKQLQAYAKNDINDVLRADWFVLFTDRASHTGGKHFETGLAWHAHKHILLVGPRENIFHYMNGIERKKEWRDAREFLLEQMDAKTTPTSADLNWFRPGF